jgi:tetratricopeptide (TPR) repeat protein
MSADADQLSRLHAELRALSGSHRYDLIADAATKILALTPADQSALYSLALAQYERACRSSADEDFTAMRETIERTLSIYPNTPEFYYLLYHYYLWYGGAQYIQARDCLLNAIKLAPQNAEYYRQLGEIYLINREADKAVKYLQEAAKLAPHVAEYRSRLALSLLRQHKATESVKVAEQALSDAPNDMRVLDTVGMIYILLGDLEKADRFFSDAIKRDPTYNYFQKHMEWIKRELKDKQQRENQHKKYTPLYIRQKGSKRFFDEDGEKTIAVH